MEQGQTKPPLKLGMCSGVGHSGPLSCSASLIPTRELVSSLCGISNSESRYMKGPDFIQLLYLSKFLARGFTVFLWRNRMKSTDIVMASKWPDDLAPLGTWLTRQGVDLRTPRSASALLELTRLIGNLRFSKKMRAQSVRWRLLHAQNRLCSSKSPTRSSFSRTLGHPTRI